MKAVLDDALFSPPHASKELRLLFELSERRGHRLELSSPDGESFARWRSSLGREAAEDYTRFLDDCLTLEDQEPARNLVWVRVCAVSNWGTEPPTLTLKDALTALDRHFRLLVENDDSDVQFLRCVMKPEWRNELDRAIESRRASWEHRGGVPNMREPVRRVTGHPAESRMVWLLFDSDAMYPGEHGEEVKELIAECEDAKVAFHCLERRSIENYLPKAALDAWAGDDPAQRRTCERKVQAFHSAFMSDRPARRHHFHLKGGFQKDQKNAAKARDLYKDMPSRDRDALNTGFGGDVRTWFRPEFVDEVALRGDNSWSEIEAFTREMIALLR